jgi:purine-binding chemotaxis protein CheW
MPGRPLQVLVFEIGGQRFGLPADDVQEVLRAVAFVPLPRAPAVVEGIINLRGQVVPVLDIRRRFRLPAKPLELTDHLVIARAAGRRVALRVDRALALKELGANDVEEAKSVVPGMEYVTWVAKQDHDLILIHDLQTFLTRTESEALAEALPSAELGARSAERQDSSALRAPRSALEEGGRP